MSPEAAESMLVIVLLISGSSVEKRSMAMPSAIKPSPVLSHARKVRSEAKWSLAVDPVFAYVGVCSALKSDRIARDNATEEGRLDEFVKTGDKFGGNQATSQISFLFAHVIMLQPTDEFIHPLLVALSSTRHSSAAVQLLKSTPAQYGQRSGRLVGEAKEIPEHFVD